VGMRNNMHASLLLGCYEVLTIIILISIFEIFK
jgi:hypothetical protein